MCSRVIFYFLLGCDVRASIYDDNIYGRQYFYAKVFFNMKEGNCVAYSTKYMKKFFKKKMFSEVDGNSLKK